MSEQDLGSIEDAKTAFKEAVDFHSEILGTIHKSHLQATQAVLAGYSEAVQKAIKRCEPAPAPRKSTAKK